MRQLAKRGLPLGIGGPNIYAERPLAIPINLLAVPRFVPPGPGARGCERLLVVVHKKAKKNERNREFDRRAAGGASEPSRSRAERPMGWRRAIGSVCCRRLPTQPLGERDRMYPYWLEGRCNRWLGGGHVSWRTKPSSFRSRRTTRGPRGGAEGLLRVYSSNDQLNFASVGTFPHSNGTPLTGNQFQYTHDFRSSPEGHCRSLHHVYANPLFRMSIEKVPICPIFDGGEKPVAD